MLLFESILKSGIEIHPLRPCQLAGLLRGEQVVPSGKVAGFLNVVVLIKEYIPYLVEYLLFRYNKCALAITKYPFT